jgi:hypothetical protein
MTTLTAVKPTQIQLTIAGQNSLNKASLEILQAIVPQVQKFEGKSILIATGLSAKFKIDKPEITADKLPNGFSSCNYYFDYTRHSLWLKVRVCLNGGSHEAKPSTAYCQYFEVSYHLGEINNTCLVNINTVEAMEKDYKLNTPIVENEERAKINRLAELAEELKQAKRSIRISEDIYKHLLY